MQVSRSLSKVYGVVISKPDGTRIYSKYYTKVMPTEHLNIKEGNLINLETQLAFEKNINQISSKLTIDKVLKPKDTEIFIYQGFNIIFKHFGDLSIFLIADFNENEMFMNEILNTIFESLNHFTNNDNSNAQIQKNFENLITVIDEVIDDGFIVILDSQTVISRVQMYGTDGVQEQQQQSSGGSFFSNYFSQAKNSLNKKLAFY